jgi:hypothetical protein
VYVGGEGGDEATDAGMKRWEGESYEDYRARRAETVAIEKAHLRGRLPGGAYVDPAMHSLLTEDESLAKAKRQAAGVIMCVVAGGIGYAVGSLIYWSI